MNYTFPVSTGANTQITAVYGRYSDGSFHSGLDLAPTSGRNANILSAVDGTVEAVERWNVSYGHHVVIHGADGYYHFYCHLASGSIAVSQGETVARGQLIGRMGSTGNSTGLHLHYEVRSVRTSSSSCLNPAELLSIRNETGRIRAAGAPRPTEKAAAASVLPQETETIRPETAEPGEYLFGRRCRVLVADETGEAAELSNLALSFEITKSCLDDIQYAQIDAYNLSRDTENFILSRGRRLTVEAGYEGSYYGCIFAGDIVQCAGFDAGGGDAVLRILSVEGEQFLTEGLVCCTLPPGQTPRTEAENLAAKAAIPSPLGQISKALDSPALPRGKACFGLARDYLNQLARSTRTTLFMDGGAVNLIRLTDPDPERIFRLTPATGLIGVPEEQGEGITARCLLIPQIRVGRTVAIDSRAVPQKSVPTAASPLSEQENAAPARPVPGTAAGYDALGIIRAFEGMELTAYQDPTGVWTIGYGHTGEDVTPGLSITEERAEALLLADCRTAAAYVDNASFCPFTAELTAAQRDALISFTFNLGPENLRRLCRGRTRAEAAEHMLAYNTAGGRVLPGLTRRRAAEYDLYTAPETAAPAARETREIPGTARPAPDGVYRITKATYTGHTRGQNWYIRFYAVPQIAPVQDVY